jgi:predicted  nucleic acid-binding Zn-ribbon protein
MSEEKEQIDTQSNVDEQVDEQQDAAADKPADKLFVGEAESTDTGEQQKGIDYEKSFKELQAAFTKETQKRAEMEKDYRKLVETLSSLGTKKEDYTDSTSRREKKIDELKVAIDSYKKQGLDTRFLDVILDHEVQLREHELMQTRFREATSDLEGFIAEYGKEIDGGQYTMKDIAAIQMEAEKRGNKIDLKTARAVYIEKNLGKIISNEVQKKLKAAQAKGHDYNEFEETGKEESAGQVFLDKVWRTK